MGCSCNPCSICCRNLPFPSILAFCVYLIGNSVLQSGIDDALSVLPMDDADMVKDSAGSIFGFVLFFCVVALINSFLTAGWIGEKIMHSYVDLDESIEESTDLPTGCQRCMACFIKFFVRCAQYIVITVLCLSNWLMLLLIFFAGCMLVLSVLVVAVCEMERITVFCPVVYASRENPGGATNTDFCVCSGTVNTVGMCCIDRVCNDENFVLAPDFAHTCANKSNLTSGSGLMAGGAIVAAMGVGLLYTFQVSNHERMHMYLKHPEILRKAKVVPASETASTPTGGDVPEGKYAVAHNDELLKDPVSPPAVVSAAEGGGQPTPSTAPAAEDKDAAVEPTETEGGAIAPTAAGADPWSRPRTPPIRQARAPISPV